MSQIKQRIHIGNFRDAQDLKYLQRTGITHILCSAAELFPVYPDRFNYKHVKANDIPSYNLARHFHEGADFIKNAIEEGGSVLIHCAAGISRSVSLTLAYFIKHEGMSLQSAYSLVKSKRFIANPNPGFMQQLMRFQNTIQLESEKMRQTASKPFGNPNNEDVKPPVQLTPKSKQTPTATNTENLTAFMPPIKKDQKPAQLSKLESAFRSSVKSRQEPENPLKNLKSTKENFTKQVKEDFLKTDFRLTGTSFGKPSDSPFARPQPIQKPPLLYNDGRQAENNPRNVSNNRMATQPGGDSSNLELFNRYLKMTLPSSYQEPRIAIYNQRTNSQTILGAYKTTNNFRPNVAGRPSHQGVDRDFTRPRNPYQGQMAAKSAFYY